MAMFTDPTVKAVLPVRGGWGCARILPHLDFDAIRRNPKVLIGYSDLTALLLAIHARTGLVTFHGPNGASDWNPTSTDFFTRVVLKGEPVTFTNPRDKGETLAQTEYRTKTITPGVARGRLLGGNLSVLTALLGSPYLPDFRDAILFLEDVDEAPYRIDRMLTQLSLAGVLKGARAVVWGTCHECEPDGGFGSLTIPDLLDDHVKPLGVPAWRGALVGHIDRQFTLPIGAEVEVDAAVGSIRMLGVRGAMNTARLRTIGWYLLGAGRPDARRRGGDAHRGLFRRGGDARTLAVAGGRGRPGRADAARASAPGRRCSSAAPSAAAAARPTPPGRWPPSTPRRRSPARWC